MFVWSVRLFSYREDQNLVLLNAGFVKGKRVFLDKATTFNLNREAIDGDIDQLGFFGRFILNKILQVFDL